MQDEIQTLRRQLQQLKELHAGAVLGDAQYEESRRALERKLVDLVLSSDSVTAAVAPAASAPRPSRALLVALATVVVVIAAAGYWWTGSPGQAGIAPAQTVAGESTAEGGGGPQGQPHAMSFEQIANMAEKLAERLKEHPDDAVGWAMLARSYAVLGRNDDAVPAYAKAVALRGDDAALLADYADVLAVKNNRKLDGEPMKLITRALELDPANVKALSLAGTAAFDRKDYATAVKHWEKIVKAGPADSPEVQQMQSNIAEARDLGKLPLSTAAPAALPASAAQAAAVTATVSGSVTLAPSLAKRVSPNDTVFVFARAADGPRMPLAALRKQVKDLPIDFKLDDSMAMSPAAKLSSSPKVVVGARVSKSGGATPAAGDLAGQSAAVPLGTTGMKIEISEVVKK